MKGFSASPLKMDSRAGGLIGLIILCPSEGLGRDNECMQRVTINPLSRPTTRQHETSPASAKTRTSSTVSARCGAKSGALNSQSTKQDESTKVADRRNGGATKTNVMFYWLRVGPVCIIADFNSQRWTRTCYLTARKKGCQSVMMQATAIDG